MKFAAGVVLLGVFAVGVFGFLGMDPAMDHGGGCIASLVNAASCPLQGIESVLYHANAFSSFTQVVFTSSLVLMLMLALLVAAHERLRLSVPNPVPISRIARSRRYEDSYKEKQLRWLSRFENSPSS